MKILIVGLGNVGKALAQRWRAAGHSVVGTTTTPDKVAALSDFADQVEVLRGSERERVREAAQGCDAVIVSVAPNVRAARTREEREKSYRETLVESCASAAAACPRVVFLSSFSVYGDGGAGEAPITEQTPPTDADEPSSRYYQEAEREVLAAGQGVVLRLPDIYGAPGDYTFAQRVEFAHKFMGGKVPFSADAPLYRIHFQDVVEAVDHALTNGLAGVFNVCDNERVPATNRVVFDSLADRIGVAPLEFLGQLALPNRKISAQKLYDTGYRIHHTQQEVI